MRKDLVVDSLSFNKARPAGYANAATYPLTNPDFFGLNWTWFLGHRNICVQRVHDGEDETTLHTGIPSAVGQAGARRPLAGGTGAGV